MALANSILLLDLKLDLLGREKMDTVIVSENYAIAQNEMADCEIFQAMMNELGVSLVIAELAENKNNFNYAIRHEYRDRNGAVKAYGLGDYAGAAKIWALRSMKNAIKITQ